MVETNEEYGKLVVLAYNNGIDLLHEAKILYEKQRYSRTYVLAILGIEEITKSMAYKNVWAGKAKPEDLFKVKKGKKTYYLKDHKLKHYVFHMAMAIQEGMKLDRRQVVASLKADPSGRSVQIPIEKAQQLSEVFAHMERDRLDATYCNINEDTNEIHDARNYIPKEKCDRLFRLVESVLPYIRFVVTMDSGLFRDANVLNEEENEVLRRRFEEASGKIDRTKNPFHQAWDTKM